MRSNTALSVVATAAVLAIGASNVAAQSAVTYLNTEFGDVLVYTAVDVDGQYNSDAAIYTYPGGVGAPANVAGLPAVFPPADGVITTPTLALTTAPTRTTAVPTVAATTSFVPGGAALGGGGGGGAVTQGTLQVIDGYNPPPSSTPRPPANQATGSILNASDIPGYSDSQVGNQNSGSAASSAASGFQALPMTLAAGLVGVLAAIVMA